MGEGLFRFGCESVVNDLRVRLLSHAFLCGDPFVGRMQGVATVGQAEGRVLVLDAPVLCGGPVGDPVRGGRRSRIDSGPVGVGFR